MNIFLSITGGILFVVLIAYPLLIIPRMFRRPDYSPFMDLYVAHRGLHNNKGEAPENSCLAFKKAIEAGYGIELDIQLSKDKIPVVFHDYTLKRVCGREGRVEDYTFKELHQMSLMGSKETIPSFEQVLELVDGRVPLIIELKIEHTDLSLCQIALEYLKKYKGVYCIESFNPLGLRWFKRNDKRIIRGQLSSDFMKDKEDGNKVLYWLLSRLLLNFLSKPDFIAYRYKHPHMTSLAIVRELYQLPTAAWTIQNQKMLEESKPYFKTFIFDSFIPDEKN